MRRGIAVFIIGAVGLAGSVSPALAWWQFASLNAQGERVASPRFNTEEECKAALKTTADTLKKVFPDRYPLVGSCEEYQ